MLFAVKGRLSSIGQHVFDNQLTNYAFLEITEETGRRVTIEKVAVCNDVLARLRLGTTGEFFVDRILPNSPHYRCQLWGIKSGGVAVMDSKDLRTQINVGQLILGLLLIPLFGVGLLLIISVLLRGSPPGTPTREKLFYGSDPAEARRLEEQQAVRI